jgi:sugar lactone lactonase YvrE
MRRLLFPSVLIAAGAVCGSRTLAAGDPPGRRAVAVPMAQNPRVAHASAVAELPDGRIIVSDAKTPALWLLDGRTGNVTALGSAGAGPEQWIRPGGLYGGRDGEILLLDRAQARVMVIGPDAHVRRTYSIAVRGVTMASDADVDLQQLDAEGFSYFPDPQSAFLRARGQKVTAVPLIRFDPLKQLRAAVADLAQPDSQTSSTGDGITVTATVIGSPADGWGVAPDGRVAIVHAQPYRVDWISSDGRTVPGSEIPHDVLPMTDADRQATKASLARGPMVGVSRSGGASGTPVVEPVFAATKAPFRPEDVVVSPEGQVWVMRSHAASSDVVTYDVFGSAGQRVDRLEFPVQSRVVGFGRGVVYVRSLDPAGQEALSRYKRM